MGHAILDAVRAHAAAAPASPALQGDREALDYAGLCGRVNTLAAWLAAEGVQRAALCGENSPDWLVADLAAWQAGVVLVPMPPFFSAAQRLHVLRAAGIGHVLLGAGCEPLSAVGEVRHSPLEGLRLGQIAAPSPPPLLPPGTCKITFTSGTTGAPKGVCLDTAMLEAVSSALAARIHAAPGMGETLRSHFSLLPLATLLENIAGAYVPLLLGKRVVVRGPAQSGLLGSSQLDLPRLLQTLQRDQPHSLIVLPQILRGLVQAAEQGRPPPDSLRFIAVGGATTPVSLMRRARALGLPVYEGYGLSECASVVALNAPGSDRIGSVGRVLPHLRLRIEDGVIQVGGNTFPGYLGEAPRRREDWLDTGDLGHLDEDGYLHVTGRRKHVLITGYGRNVSPEWVEAELSLSPAIAQVMVLGEARPFLAAIIVAGHDASPATVREAIAQANAGLPDYARVRRFVLAAEAFTVGNGLLTDNGRLRREAIAERHATALAALFAQESIPHFPATELAHDVL